MIVSAVFLLLANALLLTPTEQARADRLYTEFRCVVCQNQPISDSDAEIAAIMRRLVDERVAAGDKDTEVRDFMVQRYGEYVLLKPSLSGYNAPLWVGPVALLAAGALWVFSHLRRSAKTSR